MRRVVSLLAGVCTMFALTGSASAGVVIGVNDDAGKIHTFAPWVYSTMQAQGMRLNTLTLTWDEADPFTIPAEEAVTAAIAEAAVNGIQIALDLYPLHSYAFTNSAKCKPSRDPEACGDTANIRAFADWTANVARTFPSVRQFVAMNECNQPLFVNPQWDTSGQNQSARICGRALAAAYDAIKSVNKANFVWGVGLSPRGNDNAQAVSNSSTSPVKFIGYLGAWFKDFAAKTKRTAPLMDGFDYHPYPVPQSIPFEKGYASKNSAALSNLSRIYQAFYDGFNGSPQPTIGQHRGGGLPVSLNEVGIQTEANNNSYIGVEVSATPAGGVLGEWATEAFQSEWYSKMLNLVACDPNIRLLNIFHLVDESMLAGWQSGLYYADHTPKESALMVAAWIGSTRGNCKGKKTTWSPTIAALPDATAATGDANAKAKGKDAKAKEAQAREAKAKKVKADKVKANKAKADKANAAKAAKAKANAGQPKSKGKPNP